MSELTRTLCIMGAALLLGLAAFLVGREAPEVTADSEIGKRLVDVDDSTQVKGLKIVKFDSATSSAEEFEVAQIDGLWRIPSHQNYPADAEQHLVDAATSVMNVEILDAVSDDKGSHEEYGVLDPTELSETRGATGVGDRISLLDAERKPMAEFIIGRQIQDQPGQRYARRVGLDQVYVVKLDPSRLSTKFGDWIEEDLLQLDPFDIAQVTFDNYSVDRGINLRGEPVATKLPSSVITVSYDGEEGEWQLDSLREAVEPGKPESQLKSVSLGDNEQLNTATLNTLRTALDDLEIFDVERKPEGLKGKSLEEFLSKNRTAFASLFSRGFSVRYDPGKQAIEVISDEGDVRVGMKDGVEYVLRFGNVAGGEQREEQTPGEASEEAPGTTATSDVLRYLWVTAEVNEDLIAKPELLPLPKAREPATEKSEPQVPSAPPEGEPSNVEQEDEVQEPESSPPPDPTATDEPQLEGPEGAPGEASAAGESGEAPSEGAATDEGATNSEDGAAEATSAEDNEQPIGQAAEQEPAQEPADDAPAGEDDAEPLLEDLGPPLEEVVAENERRQKAYDEQRVAARKRVDELNEKFADWYFVISNDVYEQIHLSRDQILEAKPVADPDQDETKLEPAPGSLDEFNELRQLPE